MLKHCEELLNKTLKYSFKNDILIFMIIFLDFYSLLIEALVSLDRILKFFKYLDNSDSDNFNFLSPLYYLSKYVKSFCSDVFNTGNSAADSILINSYNNCSVNNLILMTSSLIIIFIICLYHFNLKNNKNFLIRENEKRIDNCWKYFNIIIINFMEIIFKIFGLFIFFIYWNKILYSFKSTTDIFIGIISMILFLIYSYFYFFQINYICLAFQFSKELSYHCDNRFSKIYDNTFLILKILIAIQHNIISFADEIATLNLKYVLIDILIITIICSFNANYLITHFYGGKLIFIINKKYNLIRIFLSLTLFILILIFLPMNLFSMSILYLILTFVISTAFSISIIILINQKQNELIFSDNKFIYQIVHLFNSYFFSEENYKKEISKIYNLHKQNCININEHCALCNFKSTEKFIKSLFIEAKNLVKIGLIFFKSNSSQVIRFNEEELQLFNILKILKDQTGICGKKKEITLIYYKFNKLLEKYNKKDNYSINMSVYFTRIFKCKNQGAKQFEIIKKYWEILNTLSKSISIVDSLIFTFESNYKKNLYEYAKEFNENKKKLQKDFNFILTHKNFYNDKYSLIIISFAFEKLYNCHIKEYNDDYLIKNNQDYLSEIFELNKIFIIKHDIKNDNLLVVKADRHFHQFINSSFEDIFPKRFKKQGKEIFLNLLKMNDESFTFDYIINDDENLNISYPSLDKINTTTNTLRVSNISKFIKEIKFDCKISRSYDMKEIFISLDYKIIPDEVIICEYNSIYKINRLICFSRKIGNILFLNPVWFTDNKENNKLKFYFEDLFHEPMIPQLNGILNSTYKNEKLLKHNFILEYKKYYEDRYKNKIEALKEFNHNDEFKSKLKELEMLSEENTVMWLNIIEKYEIKKSGNINLKVYSIKISNNLQSDGNLLKEKTNKEKIISSKTEIDNRKVNTDYNNKLEPLIENNYSMNLSSSSQINRDKLVFSISYATSSINSSKKLISEDESNLKRYTLTIILINIGSIIYCIIFLIIGINSSNKLNQLYNLKNEFTKFEHAFYQTALSLFYNVGIYKQNTIDMSDYTSNNYWSRKANKNITINLGDYANREMYYKLDDFKQKILDLKEFSYSSIYNKQIDEIFKLETQFYSLRISGNQITVNKDDIYFFDTLNRFIIGARVSVFNTTNTMIYIFSFNMETGKYDFSNIFSKKISNIEKSVYEMIMNYQNFYKNFHIIREKIFDLYETEIDGIFNLNYNLSIILMSIHLVLMSISVLILNYLKKSIDHNNLFLISTLNSKSIRFNYQKIHVLKDLLFLFKENPCKLKINYSKIFSENKSSKVQNKLIKGLPMMIGVSGDMEKLKLQNGKFYIYELILPMIKIIFSLFSFYFIYSSIFYYFFNKLYYSLQETSDFFTTFTKIDSNLMNYVLFLQTIMFSNQTEASLSKYLKKEANINLGFPISNGFISDLIENSVTLNYNIEKIYSSSNKFNAVSSSLNENMECRKIYSQLNDSLLEFETKFYPDNSLKISLQYLCIQYPLMNTKKFCSVYEELNIHFLYLVKIYNEAHGNYYKMKMVNDQDIFFDGFTIMVLIVRPLQNYVMDNVLKQIAEDTINSYLDIVIIYLIFNILMDIFIFLIIEFTTIKRINKINLEIKSLIKSVSHDL